MGDQFQALADDRAAELVGARVVVDPTIACGHCPACRRGETRLCVSAACVGVSADGGLATHVTVSAAGVVRVPDSVDDDHAALAEPLAVALHAVDRAQLRLGERAMVTGFGPIGAGVVLSAFAAGAREVVVVEPDPLRRARAVELGAHPVDLSDAAALRAVSGSADVAFECSGVTSAFTTAVHAVRSGGRVVVPAVSHEPVPIDSRQLVFGERTVLGTVGYHGDVKRAVDLLEAGVIAPSPLIGPTIPLTEVTRWFEEREPTSALKVLVDPSPEPPSAN